MTPEEACEYLGISLDEELDINTIEKNYKAKLSECGDDAEQRAKIEEACNVLIEVYDEFYGKSEGNTVVKKHEGLLMKLAVLMAGVFLLASAGVMYFVYKIHTETKAPQNEVVSTAEYERLRREIESMRKRQEETPTPQVAVNNSPADYTALVERVMPSMVFIQTDKAAGSGFFVSPNGDILTNHHVIEGAGYITVATRDGQSVGALVKDYDAQRDMALLKANMSYALPFLKISDMLPKQGEAVIAIGNPRGLSGTVSSGIIAAIREIDNNLWVQFTAPVSPGSSGGALINLKGEVIGMTKGTWKGEGQNLNFAVPPTVLAQFLRSAINKPARALPQPQKPSVASRPQPKPAPKSQGGSKGSGIPLPDARGFLVHKWGCSVESIRRYVSSPLNRVGNTGNLYTTGKAFKAFRAKIDTIVVYGFTQNKLNSITFIPESATDTTEWAIYKELFNIYRSPRYIESDNKEDGPELGHDYTYRTIGWELENLAVTIHHDKRDKRSILLITFKPVS